MRQFIEATAQRILLMTCVVFAGAIVSQADDAERIPAIVATAEKQRIEAMRVASAATVSIFGLDGGGGGSGVLISPDGYALTNYHVSSACGDHMRCGLNDGRVYDAAIVGIDAPGDVSLIKLYGRDDFPTAPLGDSSTVQVGQWCFAGGNPFVLASNLQPSISFGVVSGINRYQYPAGTLLEYADCIQTDAAVNPGNSGGPLFNLKGEVIGINGRCSFEKRGRVNVGVGYAISSNQIKMFLGCLKSGLLVDHATLGATAATDDSGRVTITNILKKSDAFRRGLRYGDEVISIADREVRTTNTFKNILGTLPAGWRVPITIRRAGKIEKLLVRLESVHPPQQLAKLVSGEASQQRGPERPKPAPEEDGTDKNETDKDNTDKSDTGQESQTPDAPASEQDWWQELPQDLRAAAGENKFLANHFEKRPGFANYYFNRQMRAKLWQQLQAGTPDPAARRWSLGGNLAGESSSFAAEVGIRAGTISVGSETYQISLDGGGFSDAVASRGPKGLLVALKAYQQLLEVGFEQLGESTYLGEFPVMKGADWTLAKQPLCHVVETLWYDATVRFYLNRTDAQIELIEVYGDKGVDPVEAYFSQTANGAKDLKNPTFPNVLRLQIGTEPILVAQIKSVIFDKDLGPTPKSPASSAEVKDESQ